MLRREQANKVRWCQLRKRIAGGACHNKACGELWEVRGLASWYAYSMELQLYSLVLEHADPKSLFTLVASDNLITALSSCVMLNKFCCDAGAALSMLQRLLSASRLGDLGRSAELNQNRPDGL